MLMPSRKNQIIFISGIFVLILLGIGGRLYTASDKSLPTKIQPSLYSDKFTGFPVGTTAGIEYFTAEDATAEKISMNDNTPAMTDISLQKIVNNQPAYAVHYITSNTDNSYMDIDLKVDKNTNKLVAALSGLPEQSKVSLLIEGTDYRQAVPVDWAGRLTLQSEFGRPLNGENICLEITIPATDSTASICHYISTADDFVQRQVTS